MKGLPRLPHLSRSALLALLALSRPSSPSLAQSPVDSLTDVTYVENGHPEQRLDFYWPGDGVAATVFFIHGGSLVESGERRASPPYRHVCRPFLAMGIACATTDYRLAPSFKWPAMPEDIARAVVKVRGLVHERGGDPARLFLFGHSSGCHLAAILGTDSTHLRVVGLSTRDLAGIIAMGCTLNPIDTTGRGITPERLREGFNRDRDDVMLYGTVEHRLAANPSQHLGRHVPPALVVVAEAERYMPPILEQGARFVRRLLELGRPAGLVVVPGRHMSSIQDLGAPDDPAFAAIRRFIVSPEKAGTHQPSLDIPVIDPRPDDVGTLDGIIRAFYEVISGPAGTPRHWARDRTLYVPGARLVSTGVRDEKPYAAVMSHREYAESSDGFLTGSGFFEHETHRVTRTFGNVTHVWSTYEARRTADGPVIARGVNSIQLIHNGSRWWIVSAAWDSDRPGNPIPRDFLPP